MSIDPDVERTFSIGERALELMRTYGSTATPRSYEVWYTYVTGERPVMNDALKRLVTEHGAVNEADVDDLYKTYVSSQRFTNEAEKTTASGLVIPDTAKEKPQQGSVLAVGPGRWSDDEGKHFALDVKVGDTVLYSKYGGTEVTIDGDDLLILTSRDVLAIVGS